MELKTLLAQWAELEPNRCRFVRTLDSGGDLFELSWESGTWKYFRLPVPSEDELFSIEIAVRKAVEFHLGWKWYVSLRDGACILAEPYLATVSRSGEYGGESVYGPTVYKALLTAYLRFLERK